MKRILSMLLCLTLLFVVTACGATPNEGAGGSEATEPSGNATASVSDSDVTSNTEEKKDYR